jgi:hypothetical protein
VSDLDLSFLVHHVCTCKELPSIPHRWTQNSPLTTHLSDKRDFVFVNRMKRHSLREHTSKLSNSKQKQQQQTNKQKVTEPSTLSLLINPTSAPNLPNLAFNLSNLAIRRQSSPSPLTAVLSTFTPPIFLVISPDFSDPAYDPIIAVSPENSTKPRQRPESRIVSRLQFRESPRALPTTPRIEGSRIFFHITTLLHYRLIQ